MRFSDYACDSCNIVFEYGKKNDLESFPKKVKCPECGAENKTRRIFSTIMTDIAEGLYGNAKSGYSKGFAYHPSPYSAKGTKVK